MDERWSWCASCAQRCKDRRTYCRRNVYSGEIYIVLSISDSNYVAGYQLPEEFLFNPLIGLSSVIQANFGDPIVQKYWYTNSFPMFQPPSWVVLVMWLYPRALKLLRLLFIFAQLCRDCCIKQKTVTMIKHSGSVCIIDNVCLSTIILEDIITIS